MNYVRQRVTNILTDTRPKDAWKLQALQSLLYRSEKLRDTNRQAIEIYTSHIEGYPNSDKIGEWRSFLEANQHDFELHRADVNYILEAIADIRERTIGKQLDLFG